ncbi:MAG: hypothetical protein ABSD39_12295 [Terriglobales bacterium]
MARNQPRTLERQLPLDDMEIGSANATRQHTQQHLSRAWFWSSHILDTKRTIRNLTGSTKNGCFHPPSIVIRQ